MLGEQDHGDGPTFIAKTSLIKYLHEEKGFNVLAFESDFFGLNYGWDQIIKNQPTIENFLKNNIFGIWSHCHTCSHLLYEYIPSTFKTPHPLQVTGFDNQIMLHYSSKKLMSIMDSVIRNYNLPISHSAEYEKDVLPAFADWYALTKNDTLCRKNIRLVML